jgi:Fe-S cluster assembly scaffold protein SufB
MATNRITSLSELWEDLQGVYTPDRFSDDIAHRVVLQQADKMMLENDSSHNDIYKSAVFKKLWNKKIIYLTENTFTEPELALRQPDMFEHLNEYPQSEHDEVVFGNGSFFSTVGSWTRGYNIWSGSSHTVNEAYSSILDNIEFNMPGALSSRLSNSAQVLNIDTYVNLTLTSDARNSNEATLQELADDHWSIKASDEPILNAGIYIVRVTKGNTAKIKEVHASGNAVFCSNWIYVVDYGATLELDRYINQTDGVIDNTHIIQYPNSKVKINTHDNGNQWRNINITAYQDTVTKLNGSTLLKDSDSANFVHVHHKGQNGDSDIKYNSAIYNDNTGNFIGTVQVEKKAVGTKSEMTNKNLLVDPLSRAFSKPVLHINTKEIECTHGCTTSKISEDELYYLQSLGVDRRTAKTIIANGHIQI